MTEPMPSPAAEERGMDLAACLAHLERRLDKYQFNISAEQTIAAAHPEPGADVDGADRGTA